MIKSHNKRQIEVSSLIEYTSAKVVVTSNNAQLQITNIEKATYVPRFS